jgi:leucyl aminopeptidase (aminopeptidase T)
VGGTGLSKEELAARGMNHSSLHEDVMIGAEDSRITGKCRDGRTVPLFENGVWVL